MTLRTGLDVLREREFADLKGLRAGLLTNPSAVTRDLVSAYRLFSDTPHVDLRALFSPEHGFAAAAADGAHVASGTDGRTGLPVFSLYGPSLRPTPQMLADIDVLVCDIQDIGVRYYTFDQHRHGSGGRSRSRGDHPRQAQPTRPGHRRRARLGFLRIARRTAPRSCAARPHTGRADARR
jgi:hypothetical protein